MRRPFRYSCYGLAEALGILDIDEILALPNEKIAEWMAYFLTKDEAFQERYKKEQTKHMTGDELMSLIRKQLGR